jgi:hypothetical protein
MGGRKPTRKKGAYTAAERMRRYRKRLKRSLLLGDSLRARARRAERKRELAAATARAAETLGSKLYGVIYLDPATRIPSENGLAYPTEFWDDIMRRLPAAKSCVLFCWNNRAQLANTIRRIEDRWRFTYMTYFVWGKDGYTAVDNCELLLVFSRGNPVWPAFATQELIMAPRGAHNEKPDVFIEMISRLWPNTPKLELFARKKRDGWDSWVDPFAKPTSWEGG